MFKVQITSRGIIRTYQFDDKLDAFQFANMATRAYGVEFVSCWQSGLGVLFDWSSTNEAV